MGSTFPPCRRIMSGDCYRLLPFPIGLTDLIASGTRSHQGRSDLERARCPLEADEN